MPSRPDLVLTHLERDLPTTPEDIAVLRRLRREVALSPAEYEAFLEAFPEPPAEAMRARRGPRGEPFEL